MIQRYAITVTPHASLYLGGYTAAAGRSAADTARDDQGFLIPGSAVKGALREAALRLVRGAGRGDEMLTSLFGEGGKDLGQPDKSGKLRFSPLYAATAAEPSLRHHVTLERQTRQASHQRLFANRVTPALAEMRFGGEIECLDELSDDEEKLLRAAAAITDQIGGGRGRGLGLVAVDLAAEPSSASAAPISLPVPETLASGEIVLVLEVREPLKLGVIKDLSNIESTHDVLDGSTVRGAVAGALSRRLAPDKRDAVLELVFGGDSPARFGDGRLGGAGAVPAPRTMLVPKSGGEPVDGALELCAAALGTDCHVSRGNRRSAKGTWARDAREGWKARKFPRRLVTRSARNPIDGRNAAGLLFSLELLDPRSEGSTDAPLPRFYVPVSGTAEQLRHVVDAAGHGLLVGGTRSRGFGRVTLAGIEKMEREPLEERHRRWVEALVAREVGEEIARSSGVLLALGPVALYQDRFVNALERHGLHLLGGEARRQLHGGWNTRQNLPRTILGSYVPGSTFLVRSAEGSSALPGLGAVEEHGLGPGRADGWGRFAACHPIHLDCRENHTFTERST